MTVSVKSKGSVAALVRALDLATLLPATVDLSGCGLVLNPLIGRGESFVGGERERNDIGRTQKINLHLSIRESGLNLHLGYARCKHHYEWKAKRLRSSTV